MHLISTKNVRLDTLLASVTPWTFAAIFRSQLRVCSRPRRRTMKPAHPSSFSSSSFIYRLHDPQSERNHHYFLRNRQTATTASAETGLRRWTRPMLQPRGAGSDRDGESVRITRRGCAVFFPLRNGHPQRLRGRVTVDGRLEGECARAADVDPLSLLCILVPRALLCRQCIIFYSLVLFRFDCLANNFTVHLKSSSGGSIGRQMSR